MAATKIELPEEITHLLLEKQHLSAQSLKKYTQQYRFLTDKIGSDGSWISATNELSLLLALKGMDISPAGKANYLNIIFLIRDLYNQPVAKLLKYREQLITEREKKTAEKIITKKSLPSYEEIESYIKSLYKTKDYVNYLINELIFTYGLRNKDINCQIMTNTEYKKYKKEHPSSERITNWLVLYKTNCTLIVNQYKTVGAYGIKTIKIRSRKILTAVNALDQKTLLQKKNGTPVDDTELSYYINLYTVDDVKLTESDYFKINILHLQSQPNSLTKIAEICKTRGTQDIINLDKHYNTNV